MHSFTTVGGKPLVRIEGVRQNACDEVLDVLVLQMDEVTGAVEREPILMK